MRRFLLDNDSSNLFFYLGEDVEATVAETVRECPANVTTYLLCANAGTTYFPTQVGRVMPTCPGLLAAHRRGLDPFGMILSALRRSGKETFITCRMNDVHNPTEDWNLPPVRRDHPDAIVGAEAIAAGGGEWMDYCGDYSRPEVQEYFLALMQELLGLYDVDGLSLDWMRFPRHLSGSPEEVWKKREALTEFTGRMREAIHASGKRMLLAARVPTSPAGCRHVGLDLAEWTRRGLVDFLVASPFLTTDFALPLAELRGLMGDHAVPLYAGLDFVHGEGQAHCPESLRAACLGLYGCGADGIYLFNFPGWNEYVAARPYHWLAGLETREGTARKPLLFSLTHAMHRVPGVDLPGQLPAPLPPGGSVALALELPAAALPAWRALVLVRCGGEVALAANGIPARLRPSQDQAELLPEYVHSSQSTTRPRPEECRIFAVEPEALRAGENSLTVTNLGGAELQITRVNWGLW